MFRKTTETLSEILTSDIVSSGGDLFSSGSLGVDVRHDVYRLSKSDGLLLPNVIVPALGKTDDFFATIATYYQNHSPLTAMTHVLNDETANLLSSRIEEAAVHFKNMDKSIRWAFIGSAMGETLGEALMAGISEKDLSEIASYSACKRTLSFSLCRAILIYGEKVQASSLAKKWEKLRKLTGLNVSSSAIDTVLLTHDILYRNKNESNLEKIDPSLVSAIKRFSQDENHNYKLDRILSNLYPQAENFINNLRGTFDGRMSAFLQTVEIIKEKSLGHYTDQISIAIACNSILPGSFSHAGVLLRLIETFPNILIWYGFISALSKPTETSNLNRSLINKLERDLLDSFSFEGRPRCDISLDELDVLSRTRMRPEIIKPIQQKTLLVSLIPGVDVHTRFGKSGDEPTAPRHRELELEHINNYASRLLEEALFTLKKGTKLTDKNPKEIRRNRKSR